MRYIKAILHRSIRLISRGLAIPERFLFKRLSEPDLEKAFPVFIIGAPRTGSTFLYQSITNSLDVAYIDNLVELFYDSFCAGFFISKALYGNKPHNNFVSYHGNTRRLGGLHAPSECGAFWYRWLPLDDHYVRSQDIDGASKKEIRTNIKCALAIVKRPIIFKNLNAGQRLDLLNNVFPESRFIFIKRDPLATAQSIYNAKQRVNYRPDQWWSIKPKNWRELEKLDYADQIVKQVYFIEKQIAHDLKNLGITNSMTINYADLVKDVPGSIETVRRFIGDHVRYRPGALAPKLEYSDAQSVPDEVYFKLKRVVEEHDWENYTSH